MEKKKRWLAMNTVKRVSVGFVVGGLAVIFAGLTFRAPVVMCLCFIKCVAF